MKICSGESWPVKSFVGSKSFFTGFLVFIFGYPSPKANYINHIDMIFDIRFLFIWKLLFTYKKESI